MGVENELEARALALAERQQRLDELERELEQRENALRERQQRITAAEKPLAEKRSADSEADREVEEPGEPHPADSAYDSSEGPRVLQRPTTLLHAAKQKKHDTGTLERIESETATVEQQEHYNWYENRLQTLTEERSRLYSELMQVRQRIHELSKQPGGGALDRVASLTPGLKTFSSTAAKNEEVRSLQHYEGELVAMLRRVVTEVMTVTRWLEKHESWRPQEQQFALPEST